MNVLEQRYRRVLRVLPDSYRQAWEEDMVATFLASMDTDDVEDAEFLADYGRPSWSEVASVARLAVRLRIGGTGVPPLSVGLGEAVRAVRLVALAVLLLSAVWATWGVWRNPWLANEIPWLPVPDEVPAFSMGFWEMAWNVVGLLWVAAFLALVFGRWWAARLFAVLAFLPGVGFAVRDTLAGNPVFARWSDVLVTALLLFTLAAFHRDIPPVRPRPWLIAFAVGVALTPAAELVILTLPMDSRWLLGWPGLNCVLILAAALVYLGGQALGRSLAPSWEGPKAMDDSDATSDRPHTLSAVTLRRCLGTRRIARRVAAVDAYEFPLQRASATSPLASPTHRGAHSPPARPPRPAAHTPSTDSPRRAFPARRCGATTPEVALLAG